MTRDGTEELHRGIVGPEFRLIADCGHCPPLEHPNLVCLTCGWRATIPAAPSTTSPHRAGGEGRGGAARLLTRGENLRLAVGAVFASDSPVRSRLVKQLFWVLMTMLPTSMAATVVFRLKLGRWPRRHEPMSFNDRLHAAKLHWRDPLMTRLVDKVEVKYIVAGILGPDWVTPTLYTGPHLPPRAQRNWPYPYVIKTNHSSGTNYFVRSKADEDWPKIDKLFDQWLAMRHNPKQGEWQYLGITPKILVEPMIMSDGSLPVDFKIFTFSGKAVVVQVFPDRETERSNVFFDRSWNRKNFCRAFGISALEIKRPASLELMLAAAERLSLGLPFVRIDFYEVDGCPRFGEVTFFPNGGYARFTPPEKDDELGEIWRAEEIRARGHDLVDYTDIALERFP